jgi:hypothetical protein
MLPPDQWDSVLGSITGTIVHGSERVGLVAAGSQGACNSAHLGDRRRIP